jgi:hypothetical protein
MERGRGKKRIYIERERERDCKKKESTKMLHFTKVS